MHEEGAIHYSLSEDDIDGDDDDNIDNIDVEYDDDNETYYKGKDIKMSASASSLTLNFC